MTALIKRLWTQVSRKEVRQGRSLGLWRQTHRRRGTHDNDNGKTQMFRLKIVLIALALFGCQDAAVRFPVTEGGQRQLKDITVVPLDAKVVHGIASRESSPTVTTLPVVKSDEYRIGPGDVISVFVFDHPELAVPAASASVTTGYLVQTDGKLSFPFIDSVTASGRTVGELREQMTERLSVFFPDPQVHVRIASFNSQKVVVGGEVAAPTTHFVKETPLTLLEAINAAGGMTEEADASAITVRRDGINHRVDLEGFLGAGLAGNNPVLIGGDVVSVPRKALKEAYLLGEVQKPATVDLTDDQVSLTQALTRQGGLNEARADARGVLVFREVEGRMTVYQLDMSLPTSLLLGTRFALRPMDVVYITKSPLQRWNDTISRILPTVSALDTVSK